MLRQINRPRLTLQQIWANIVNAITAILGADQNFHDIYQLHEQPQPYIHCLVCNTDLGFVNLQTIRRHHLGVCHQNRANADEERLQLQLRQWNMLYAVLDDDQRTQYAFEVFGQVGMIKCQCCWTRIITIDYSHLMRHHGSAKHQKFLLFKRRQPEPDRQAWESCSSRQNACWLELCIVFVKCAIPFGKLTNQILVDFLEKWMGIPMPDASTLRKNYLAIINTEILTMIRQTIGDNSIQILVDETTDVLGRKLAVLKVMPLLPNHFSKPLVIWMDELVSANGEHIANFVETGLQQLWPEGIHRNRVLSFTSDGAYYMMTAYELLRARGFDKLIHVKCLAHRLHRIAETVRRVYPRVNDLVSLVKKIFRKSPARQFIFNEELPGVPLPPRPVTVRWGTWLHAVFYYNQIFNGVMRVVDMVPLHIGDPLNIVARARRVFRLLGLRRAIHTISNDYRSITDAILQLEIHDLTLNDALRIMNETSQLIHYSPTVPAAVKNRMGLVMVSPQFETLRRLNECHETMDFNNRPLNWTEDDVHCTRRLLTTTCDVERTFSALKYI